MQDLLQHISTAARQENLLPAEHRLLIAVSGGLDSVVLCDLLAATGWSCGIAHANFQLRGAASEADASFVQKLAEDYGWPYYGNRFETQQEATAQRNKSIQMLAREQRYEWLEQVRAREGYQLILTAHHLNDALETFVKHFTEGSGLRGLKSIPARRGRIWRPLLSIPRADLEAYYAARGLEHREDASNTATYYQRNQIRQEIIPALTAVFPQWAPGVQRSLELLRDAIDLLDEQVRRRREEVLEQRGEITILHDTVIQAEPGFRTLLFELLRPYAFSAAQVQNLLQAIIDRNVGAQFYSADFRLLVDRDRLLIQALRKPLSEQEFVLAEATERLSLPQGVLSWMVGEGRPAELQAPGHVAYLDYDQLLFPLRLRHWKAGDSFQPLGMRGQRKKLKDFFVDQKLDRFAKERVWILENGDGEICWIINQRLDHRFRITDSTRKYLRVAFSADEPL